MNWSIKDEFGQSPVIYGNRIILFVDHHGAETQRRGGEHAYATNEFAKGRAMVGTRQQRNDSTMRAVGGHITRLERTAQAFHRPRLNPVVVMESLAEPTVDVGDPNIQIADVLAPTSKMVRKSLKSIEVIRTLFETELDGRRGETFPLTKLPD